jgi:hypothetical protein
MESSEGRSRADRLVDAFAPANLWAFLSHWQTRYVACWAVAVALGAVVLSEAWESFDDPGRQDGNSGHAQIDFGGQWLMGRMLLEGHGRQLYERNYQRALLQRFYTEPAINQSTKLDDVESLMYWMMGGPEDDENDALAGAGSLLAARDGLQAAAQAAAAKDYYTPERQARVARKRIGGPLYPPVNAYVALPLALFPPQVAYRIQQVNNLLLALLAGLGVSYLSRGQFWWPLATAGILLFPGFSGSINLGQNATLTLTILVWGWALIARDHPWWAGAVWGLLVFKPVWMAAFFWVLVVTGRWRTAAAVLVTAALLAASTLPAVGVQSWRNWYLVGKEASDLYKNEGNWIALSRDLLGLPRRWMNNDNWTFAEEPGEPAWRRLARDLARRLPGATETDKFWPAELAGWCLLGPVILLTAGMALWRRKQAQATTGPAPAFLLLGGWLSCYHFMYYDVLLAAVPLAVLFAEPRRWLEPLVVCVRGAFSPRWPLLQIDRLTRLPGGSALLDYYRPRLARSYPELPPGFPVGHDHLWVVNSVVTYLVLALFLLRSILLQLEMDLYRSPPYDTFLLLAIWLTCGVMWLWQGREAASQKEGAGTQEAVALAAKDPVI